jgi:threonine synthase
MATELLRLACSECGAAAAGDAAFCPACSGLLAFELAHPTAPAHDGAALRELFHARRTSNEPLDRSGVWRFRELLPSVPLEWVTTLLENRMPLYSASRGAGYAEAARVAYLHLGMNPTGSFKDAGMTVALSQAAARGSRLAVCASTGNTAASMAAYAARAGLRALVLVPAGAVSEAKMAQTLDYGATVAALSGDFDEALAFVRTLHDERIALVNSVNPYRIEGQKCAAFALLEQRGWNVPDWVVLPGGNLGNSSAFGKGFREAQALGLVAKIPRLAVAQAAGAAPFARAFASGLELVPVKAETSATAIRIGAPASWRKALREVRLSGGTVVAVDDAEIADARAVIGRDGVGCEPASAASLAALRQLRAAGTIARDDDVVLILTGHVLKDGGYAARYHASGARYANTILEARDGAALRETIARACETDA